MDRIFLKEQIVVRNLIEMTSFENFSRQLEQWDLERDEHITFDFIFDFDVI